MPIKKFSDEIRDAVEGSGLTRYRIAKELGIAESTMSRFMSAKGGLSLENIDRLAKLLGLGVVVNAKHTKPGD